MMFHNATLFSRAGKAGVRKQHIANEMYARDISKKIRSSLDTKMREGSFIGAFAPYGYQKMRQGNRTTLIVDDHAAPVVREIFRLAAEGLRPSDIAARLNGRGIAPPSVHRQRANPDICRVAADGWSASTICKMLGNTVYLGHTAQGKTRKPTFKSRTAALPPNEWTEVRDTHRPLVDAHTFALAGRHGASRRQPSPLPNLFDATARCADCGARMSPTGRGGNRSLICNRYKLHGRAACTGHRVGYDLLCVAVLGELRRVLSVDGDTLRSALRPSETHSTAPPATASLDARFDRLETLMARLYEDAADGTVTPQRFDSLLRRFEEEQREVCEKRDMLRRQMPAATQGIAAVLEQLRVADTLRRDVVTSLIERIEVGEGVVVNGVKRQTLRIVWNFAQ